MFLFGSDADASDAEILEDMVACQSKLHAWGDANQVLFEADKESYHILHSRRPYGDCFRLLGVTFDVKLVMEAAIQEISAQAHN